MDLTVAKQQFHRENTRIRYLKDSSGYFFNYHDWVNQTQFEIYKSEVYHDTASIFYFFTDIEKKETIWCKVEFNKFYE